MLVVIALAGQAMWSRLHTRLARFAPWVLGANALLLAALAVRVAVGAPDPIRFTLLDGQGETVTEASFAGRPLLIYFGYTYCPDICPTSLATLAEALERLPPATRDRLVPMVVTIDPERDSPERMAAYAAVFSPRLVGLGGNAAEIATMTARFAVPVSRVEGTNAASYTLDHGALFHLVGTDRRIIARFADRLAPEALAQAIERRLEE
jgi:protein SCO1/2